MSGESEPHSLVRSQADLMAGVAGVFFVLLAIFMIKDARKDQADQDKLAKYEREHKAEDEARLRVQDTLLALQKELGALKTDLENDGVEAQLEGNKLEINIDPQGTKLRFESGQEHLARDVARDARDRVRHTLEIVCRVMRSSRVHLIEHIVLEGHTDNVRVLNARSASSRSGLDETSAFRVAVFGGNVDLSSRRAVHVLRLVMEDPASNDDLRACIEDHFLIAGRGPVQPVDDSGKHLSGTDWFDDEQTAAGRDRSRRVVLRVSGRQDYANLAKELAMNAGR